MNKFTSGFEKVAISGEAIAGAAKKVGKGALEVGKGILGGARESMKGSVGDALKMKGLKNISDAATQHGAAGLKTPAGQKGWGQAIGKAAPSLAAGAGYGVAAKKVYDKAVGSDKTQQYY